MSIKRLPSPAMVVACLALFVAMGGTGYAATQFSTDPGKAAISKKHKVKRGPRGRRGPAGAQGPAGAAGAAGAKGATGAISSPSSLFRRTRFLFESVPSGSFATIATVSGTPQSTGNALVRARGYCNIAADATGTNEIDLAVGSSLADASSSEFSEWGVIRILKSSETTAQAYGWTAEREIPVTAGVPITGVLAAEGSGSGLQKDCSGTLTIEAIF